MPPVVLPEPARHRPAGHRAGRIGADGSGERRLTSNGRTGAADEPTWSPDSRAIAFAYNAG